jgi:cation diffusion facilitator CzcD-associated flavoprotein CzcO
VPSFPVIVIGAGPAGLATSRELRRRGVDHIVLERGDGVGHTWANLYDSLVLHTGKHLSGLPGLPLGARAPLFPPRALFVEYLHQYASIFRLPIRTCTPVERVAPENGAWRVTTPGGDLVARAVVMATGIVANPILPALPGRERFRGQVMHSVEYRRPAPFAGRRVLVVGTGNSAGEIAPELARAGAEVTLSVRSGAVAVPRELLGLPIQYAAVVTSLLPAGLQRSMLRATARLGELMRGPSPLPRPPDEDGARARRCPDVPLIGFHLTEAIREGLIRVVPALESYTPDGARFADGSTSPFDVVILATGFRPALAPLGPIVTLDRCGFASRAGRVVSTDQPGLYFVGQTYDRRGGLFNIGRDAKRAAGLIARY